MLRPLTTVLVTLAVSVLALGSPLCCIVDVGCCPTPEAESKAPCCPHCRPPQPEPEPAPDPAPKCDWCDHPADLTPAVRQAAPAPLVALCTVDLPVVNEPLVRIGPAPEGNTAPPRVEPARNLPLLL